MLDDGFAGFRALLAGWAAARRLRQRYRAHGGHRREVAHGWRGADLRTPTAPPSRSAPPRTTGSPTRPATRARASPAPRSPRRDRIAVRRRTPSAPPHR